MLLLVRITAHGLLNHQEKRLDGLEHQGVLRLFGKEHLNEVQHLKRQLSVQVGSHRDQVSQTAWTSQDHLPPHINLKGGTHQLGDSHFRQKTECLLLAPVISKMNETE